MIKFPAVRNTVDHKIAMIVIDTTNQYPNSWTRELVKNSIDFEISTASWEGLDVFVSYNEDQALGALVGNYRYALVVSSGFMVGHNNNFYDHLKTFCVTNDFLVAGHILDNQDAYYELHGQGYIIDLIKYQNLNCPKIGQQQFHDNHTQVVPLRSLDNFHDTYTPVWISPGTASKKYLHKCHGWNIIAQGFLAGYNVLTFNEKLRSLKTYFYPDDTELVNKLYIEHDIAARSWVNPFGTSDYTVLGEKTNGNLDYFISPCIGIDFVHFLVFHGFDSQTVVRFVDYNLLSLEFMKQLVEWDGDDYIKFLEKFGSEKTQFLNMDSNSWFGVRDDLENRWKQLQSRYNWPELWSQIKAQVKFEFRFTDFLHLGNNSWLGSELNSERTVINFSNIFNYYSTSILHTLRYRVDMENKLIRDIKNIAPNSYLLFDHRAWRGFKPYTKYSNRAKAKDIETISLVDLTMPSWHYGGDW
jgi:hypothetical protein